MSNPTCPHCRTEMRPQYFSGYYESFPMWTCACQVIPKSRVWSGAYGSASSLDGELVEDNREWLGLDQ